MVGGPDRRGHIPRIRTLDADPDFWLELQILELRESVWIVFRRLEVEEP